MEDIFDMNDSMGSPLDEINPLGEINTDHLLSPLANGVDTLSVSHSNPFYSGFDAEHPMPTFEELRNAGFTKEVAEYILYSPTHFCSEESLHNCLSSENPVEAYQNLLNSSIALTNLKCELWINQTKKDLWDCGIFI